MTRATLGPIEPDHRYLRRLGNRRVRKARLARNAARWAGIVLFQLALAGVLAYTGWSVAQRVVDSPRFELLHVELDGANRAPANAIREEMSNLLGRNVFELDLVDVERRLMRNAWVRSASVKRVLPDTLRLRIVEREPAAIAVIDGRPHLVDGTGYVIGPWTTEMPDRFAVLTGMTGMDDDTLAATLRRGVDVLHRLDDTAGPFAESLVEMDVTRDDRVTVREVPSGPRILLDPARVERNVIEYLALRDQIERRLGQVQTVDLRWRDRITVMPAGRADSRENG